LKDKFEESDLLKILFGDEKNIDLKA